MMMRWRDSFPRGALLFLVLAVAFASTASALGLDCDGNGVPDEEQIEEEPDCNGNEVPDACDLLPRSVRAERFFSTSTGSAPWSPAAGDLDGDGDLDLVACILERDQVALLRNAGDGALSASFLEAGDGPAQAVPADLDRDGDLDLAVVNASSGTITIHRNVGGGSFAAPVSLEGRNGIRGLLVLDLDGDGDQDLAWATNPSIGVHLQAEGGSFGPSRVFNNGFSTTGTSGLAAGDFDADGDPDLACAHEDSVGRVIVLANDGLGAFQAPAGTLPVGRSPADILGGDLDGDRHPDLVTLNAEGDGVSVLLYPRSPSFLPAWTYPPGPPPMPPRRKIAHGGLMDLDGDGTLDLLAGDEAAGTGRGNAFLLYINRGDGRFKPPQEIPLGFSPHGFARGDFDGDGRADLAVADGVEPRVLLLDLPPAPRSADCDGNGVPDECDPDCDGDRRPDRCQMADSPDCNDNLVPDACEPDCDRNGAPDDCDIASGSAPDCNGNSVPDGCDLTAELVFEASQDLTAGGYLDDLRAGDIDADGDLDLAALDRTTLEAVVFLRLEGRRFSPPRRVDVDRSQRLIDLVDVDGTAGADLVLTRPHDQVVAILAGRGDGTFRRPSEIAVGESSFEARMGDLDDDGAPDLILTLTRPRKLRVHWNNGWGTFEAAAELPEGEEVILGDLNGDGRRDIISGDVWFSNVAPRILGPMQFLEALSGDPGEAADLDGDGDDDLLIPVRGEIRVQLNRGNGRLAQPVSLPWRSNPWALDATDVDGDGDLDVAVEFSTFLGDGRGNLVPGPSYASTALSIVAADLDGDGKTDLASTDGSERAHILWNGGKGKFQGGSSYALRFRPDLIAAADLDGDLRADIIASSRSGIGLLRNAGAGQFEPWLEMTGVGLAGVVDLDQDGSLDILAMEPRPSLIRNLGGGRFSIPEPLVDVSDVRDLELLDLEGDGDLDLALALSESVQLFADTGGLVFEPYGPPYPALETLAVLDLEGDGDPDLAAAAVEPRNAIQLLMNAGDGHFAAGSLVGDGLDHLLSLDVDGDGDEDLAATQGSQVVLYLNDGSGGFPGAVRLEEGDNLRSLAAIDLDGDGDPDLAASSAGDHRVLVFRNDGATFLPPLVLDIGLDPTGVAAADLDGDLLPDLAVASGEPPAVNVFLNRSRSSSPDRNLNRIPDECDPPAPFHRGDANQDGALDISDGLKVFRFLYQGDAVPDCLDASDANADGNLDISDGIFLLGHLFLGTAAPPPPGPPSMPCGPDPDLPGAPGHLGCVIYDRC